MIWYLLDASDSSLCIVFEKNILQAGKTSLDVDEEVTFFYQGKQYSGTILAKNSDRDALDAEMKKMLKESKAKRTQSLATKETVSGKRKITAPTFYGNHEVEKQKKTEPPKTSEEEKTRQRILDRNKKEAEKRSNRGILTKTNLKTKEDSDPNWTPYDDDRSMDSIIYDTVAHDKELSKSKSSIVRKILQNNDDESSSDENVCPSPSKDELKKQSSSDENVCPSPSKDELKKQLELMRKQLEKQKAETSNSSNYKEARRTNQESVEDDNSSEKNTKGKRGTGQNSENEEEISTSNEMDEGKGRKQNPSGEGDDVLADTSTVKDDEGDNSHDSSLRETGNSKRKRKADRDLSSEILDDLADLSNHKHLDSQLYGKAPDTKELAKLGIYCKTDDLGKALSGSTNVNHLLRRIMEGVFDPDKILNCTVTGRSWHAGGPAAIAAKHDPLHPKALKAILDFSNAIAKSKKWSRIKFEEARPVFAIKLTEMKKKAKRKSLDT